MTAQLHHLLKNVRFFLAFSLHCNKILLLISFANIFEIYFTKSHRIYTPEANLKFQVVTMK